MTHNKIIEDISQCERNIIAHEFTIECLTQSLNKEKVLLFEQQVQLEYLQKQKQKIMNFENQLC